MEIIGKVNSSTYLAQVSHTELEKAAGLYYGKLKPLDVGDLMDLGAGYDYRADIQAACDAMVDAVKKFERAQRTMLAFARMVGGLDEPEADAAGGEA